MNKKILFGAFVVLANIISISVAHAAALTLNPSTSNVDVNDLFSVDIIISGLESGGIDEIVSAFDLNVSYDSQIITANSVDFGAFLGDPSTFEALNDSDLSTSGIVNLAGLSFLSDLTLQSIQPDSFVLATIEFTALLNWYDRFKL